MVSKLFAAPSNSIINQLSMYRARGFVFANTFVHNPIGLLNFNLTLRTLMCLQTQKLESYYQLMMSLMISLMMIIDIVTIHSIWIYLGLISAGISTLSITFII